MSDEHVVPKWLSRTLPTGTTVVHLPGYVMRGGKPVPPKANVFETPLFELKVRCTCQKRCNGGWMNDLEQNSAHALKLMIQGVSLQMTLEGQARLALWAVKTAMMAEHAREPQERYIPKEHYPGLGDRGVPPPITQVRLFGSIADADRVAFSHQRIVPPDDGGPPAFEGYRATFAVGRFGYEVIGSHPPNNPLRIQWRTGIDAALVPIWPPERQTINWPGSSVFDNDTLRDFMEGEGLG